MSTARSVKILLELAELAPVEQLEVMLEPVVLLELLDAFGHPREETKAALGAGTLPGELLRGLLETHGAEAVWEKVPPSAKRGVRPAPAPAEGIFGRLQNEKQLPRAQRWTSLAGLCVLVWAAMWMAGAFPEWGVGPGLGTAIASCLGGAAAFGALTVPRSAGMLGGFLAGLANVGVAWLWRAHYPHVPVGRLVSIALVALPLVSGLLLSWALERALTVRGAPRGF